PGPQQGGWGPPPAPGGHWNSGWGPAPAAKPGVIPLRPLGVGEILDGAVSTMRAHWRTVLGLTLTVAVITQIADILVQRYLLPDPPEIDSNATGAEALDQAMDSLRSSMLSLLPVGALALVGTLFVTAVLTVVISRSVLGRAVTLREAWTEARPRLLPLLGLLVLLPVMAGAVVGVGVLPGVLIGSDAGAALAALGGLAAFVLVIWLLVRFSLAAPALMLERQSLMKSLRRSAKLVRGAWWRIFGITLLTILLTSIVSMIIAIPFTVTGMIVDDGGSGSLFSGNTSDFGWPFLIITGIGAVIGSAITYPISAGVAALLYIDQRIRREALDLDLARAANLPGHETSGS
ncbi:glycerophosphoryl diester phosphodiesterase membrane domain-containing protein, partial [Streptomyces sp. YS-3]|uniref:glycerophosphoryl diester phosphodiesterase membrane domain-containing protein n=1 Tax=Streptomyces sp. YS-3 TaxID=3381352 RepID=UPI003862A65A